MWSEFILGRALAAPAAASQIQGYVEVDAAWFLASWFVASRDDLLVAFELSRRQLHGAVFVSFAVSLVWGSAVN